MLTDIPHRFRSLRYAILLTTLLLSPTVVRCLPTDTSRPSLDPSRFGGVIIGAGYLGENLSHPGGFLTVDFPLSFRRRSFIEARVEVAGYLHPRNSWAIMAQGGIGFGSILPCGFLTGISVGIGYIHTFLGAPLYTVIEKTGFDEYLQIPDRGQPGFLFDITGRIGWDWGDFGVPLRIFLAFKSFGRVPYNGMVLPHFALQPGVALRIRHGAGR